jgi:hypothetical protein
VNNIDIYLVAQTTFGEIQKMSDSSDIYLIQLRKLSSLEDYRKKCDFLPPNEKLLRVPDDGLHIVHLGLGLNLGLRDFGYEQLREPVLTNKRFLLLKEGTIDYEIPITDVIGADNRTIEDSSSLVPYLIIKKRNGEDN